MEELEVTQLSAVVTREGVAVVAEVTPAQLCPFSSP